MNNVITRNELQAMLAAERGATFIGLSYRSQSGLKAAAKREGAYKLGNGSFQVNFQYDGAVRRQAEREGIDPDEFVGGSSWHEAVVREDGTLTPFSAHKDSGKLYLRVRRTSGEPSRYFDGNGNRVEAEAVMTPSALKGGYGNQPSEKKIMVQTIGFDSVVGATINGTVYTVA